MQPQHLFPCLYSLLKVPALRLLCSTVQLISKYFQREQNYFNTVYDKNFCFPSRIFVLRFSSHPSIPPLVLSFLLSEDNFIFLVLSLPRKLCPLLFFLPLFFTIKCYLWPGGGRWAEHDKRGYGEKKKRRRKRRSKRKRKRRWKRRKKGANKGNWMLGHNWGVRKGIRHHLS